MMSLTFSPGSGGDATDSCCSYAGGGGGGVLINGIGPSGESPHGEGYGAGAGGVGSEDGHAGVIILELNSNP